MARAFGAPVPQAEVVTVPPGLPWTAGTDEFDAQLQRSWGPNLGVTHVEGARPATARDVAALSPREASAIASADRFLANVDRGPPNPNLLVGPGGRVVAIDYGACLFLSRALSGRVGEVALPPGHLLPQAAPAPIPPLPWDALSADLPGAWIAAAGADRGALLAALAVYEAAARAAWD